MLSLIMWRAIEAKRMHLPKNEAIAIRITTPRGVTIIRIRRILVALALKIRSVSK
jgi:hypothetical protein